VAQVKIFGIKDNLNLMCNPFTIKEKPCK